MTPMTTGSIHRNPQMEVARADFIARYPDYAGTAALDRLRAADYDRLDRQGQVYLDYTGGSLYAEKQVEQHFALLRSGVFGNPHSTNPTSTVMTEYVERTRQHVLNYFNTGADDYT